MQVSDILQQSHPQHCYKHGKKLAKLVWILYGRNCAPSSRVVLNILKNMNYDGMPKKTVSLAKKLGLLDDAANGEELLNALGAEVTTTELMEFQAAGRATSWRCGSWRAETLHHNRHGKTWSAMSRFDRTEFITTFKSAERDICNNGIL